jgi:hypothetical protein
MIMTEDEAAMVVQEMWERGWRSIETRHPYGTLDSTGKVFTPNLSPDGWTVTARRYPETIQVNSIAEWEEYKQRGATGAHLYVGEEGE